MKHIQSLLVLSALIAAAPATPGDDRKVTPNTQTLLTFMFNKEFAPTAQKMPEFFNVLSLVKKLVALAKERGKHTEVLKQVLELRKDIVDLLKLFSDSKVVIQDVVETALERHNIAQSDSFLIELMAIDNQQAQEKRLDELLTDYKSFVRLAREVSATQALLNKLVMEELGARIQTLYKFVLKKYDAELKQRGVDDMVSKVEVLSADAVSDAITAFEKARAEEEAAAEKLKEAAAVLMQDLNEVQSLADAVEAADQEVVPADADSTEVVAASEAGE